VYRDIDDVRATHLIGAEEAVKGGMGLVQKVMYDGKPRARKWARACSGTPIWKEAYLQNLAQGEGVVPLVGVTRSEPG
jgi:hypothetical protein